MKGMVLKLGVTAVMLLSFLSSLAYDFEVDGIYYTVVSVPDLTCAIVSGDVEYSGDFVIPSEVDYNGRTLKVMKIYGAFSGCTSLTSVTIPDSVTEIGDYAFEDCTSLTLVTIPDSVTGIGFSAFEGCTSLTSVSIPDSVTGIGDGAFRDCTSLISVSIGDSVTEIGGSAFSGCTSLTSVTIPDSVIYIRSHAFSECSSLKEIKLSNQLRYISAGTFLNCISLSSITIPGSVDEIYWNKYDPYHSPTVYDFLFQGCDNLNEIIFENGNFNIEFYVEYGFSGREKFLFVRDYKHYEITYLPITSLIIDRGFDDYKEDYSFEIPSETLPYVKNVTLGSHISESPIAMEDLESLETITCLSATPPDCGNFSHSQYLNITVKVPFEYLEAYQKAEPWRNFWNLQGFDPSGIDDVDFDSTPTETGRYDLNGRPVSDSYEGIAIIRYSDGSTKKAVVRK